MALEHIHREEMKSPSLTGAERVLAVIAAQPGLVQFSSNWFGKNVFAEAPSPLSGTWGPAVLTSYFLQK